MKKPWIYITLIFLVGLILGTAIGRWSGQRHPWMGARGEKGFERKFEFFSNKLKLTSAQQEQVKNILRAERDKIEAFKKEWEPKHQAFHESFVAEIRTVLDEDQIAIFEKMEAKRLQRRGGHNKRRPGRW